MINAPHVRAAHAAQPRRTPLVAAGAIAAGILALDVTTPAGLGVCELYVVPLLIASTAGSPTLPMYGAWIGSLLIAARLLMAPLVDLSSVVIVNRAVALIVIWTTAFIVLRLRETTDRLETRTRDLDDMRQALDQSAIVATTNTKGTITYVNDKFCEISKYSREELLGQDHRILNSGYHPKAFIRDLWVTIANGRIWRGELRNVAKDGSIYWVDTTIVPFLDQHDKPYQYMAIRYEITDRKRSEETLREQAALTRLGEMAAIVAHEVKNPIAGIRGALQVIVARMPAEQRDRAIIGEIIARLDALNLIVQDLLLYSRPREPRREAVDVATLIGSIGELLHRDPALSGVTVRVMGALDAVAGDSEQLRIVFQNLLMNAAQAMSGQGAIDVTLERDSEGHRIAIRDHGPGMPREVRDKAFDAFFTTKHRGTGLGLPIARRVVEAHGGQIDILDAEGGGTVFLIRLPRA
jgi:PAS domain S-box-containing protein